MQASTDNFEVLVHTKFKQLQTTTENDLSLSATPAVSTYKGKCGYLWWRQMATWLLVYIVGIKSAAV